MSYTYELWAAAGQCVTSKGTLVGAVMVKVDASGNVKVTYSYFAGYIEAERHVYAGGGKYPQVRQGRTMVDTVAPGQYTFNPIPKTSGWVIAHAVVGIPDPNFGPTP
ncbi:MAG: hypothetical protein AB4911_23680 [Oscillochloridaceae bacterium umkhey_bin13]